MAGTRGATLTPAELEYGIIKYQNRFIWSDKILKANDIVYSYQNIDTPINHQPAHPALNQPTVLTWDYIKPGIITIAPNGANNNLTLGSTDSLINGLFEGVAGVSSQQVYNSWRIYIINLDGAAQTATIVAGDSDTTITGNVVVAGGVSAAYDVVLESSSTLIVRRIK